MGGIKEVKRIKKLRDFIENQRKNFISLILVLIIILFIGIFFLFSSRNNQTEEIEDDPFDSLLLESENQENNLVDDSISDDVKDIELVETNKIIVDLKGAVNLPGVYEMEKDQRVIDCINKGGGFSENAEQKAVNLAQKIEDQMVIYIPVKGENLTGSPGIVGFTNKNPEDNRNNKKIHLNKTTKEELKSLSGIGDVKAENIINYRETNGFFQKIEEIKNVSGIGQATFEKLKDEITVIP